MERQTELLIGWGELTKFLGVGSQVIARWQTLRNFPKHEIVTRDRKWTKAWRKQNVLDWAEKNNFVLEGKETRVRKKAKQYCIRF